MSRLALFDYRKILTSHVSREFDRKGIASDVDTWFAELDRFADVPLSEDGRNQPPVPAGEDIFG
jgi:hypothetical protein